MRNLLILVTMLCLAVPWTVAAQDQVLVTPGGWTLTVDSDTSCDDCTQVPPVILQARALVDKPAAARLAAAGVDELPDAGPAAWPLGFEPLACTSTGHACYSAAQWCHMQRTSGLADACAFSKAGVAWRPD